MSVQTGGALEQDDWFVRHDNRAENGISDLVAPFNCLVGVFLDDAQPNVFPAPAALDFSPNGNVADGVDYERISPALRQVFFIGDGFNAEGHRHEVVVPARATRLFLGTMDGYGWFNNLGRFDVRVHSERFSVAADVTASLIRGTNHGSVQLNGDGSFLYIPNQGFQGEDSFRYRLESSERLRSNIVTVTIRVDPIAGDVDGNGRVDLGDFAVLKQNFGKSGDRAHGDLDGDGLVSLNDFAILKESFGRVDLERDYSDAKTLNILRVGSTTVADRVVCHGWHTATP